MSQFLVLSRRRTEQFADSDFAPMLPAETDRVRELYAAGVIRQIWLRQDIAGAAFIVEAEDLAAARAIVDALPMASSGLSDFTVVGLSPYRGFAPD